MLLPYVQNIISFINDNLLAIEMDRITYLRKNEELIELPVYEGKIVDIMPELIANGEIPLSIADVMRQRVRTNEYGDLELAALWFSNYFDSRDSMKYHGGRSKICLSSKTLMGVDTNSTIDNGSLSLIGDFVYCDGYEISESELEKQAHVYVSDLERLFENPFWLNIA